MLNLTLQEEKDTDEKLTNLAAQISVGGGKAAGWVDKLPGIGERKQSTEA
jgi:hypothetical protein